MSIYQHGGDIYTNQVDMDYSANLNPLGMPLSVKRAAADALEHCGAYPDSSCGSLRACLEKTYGIPMENCICGNGAAELLFNLVLVLKPQKAVVLTPSFLEYEQALKTVDCQVQAYELKRERGFSLVDREGRLWPDFISCLKQSGAGMLFLCNPNNPTGLAVPGTVVEKVLDTCRENGIFVMLDECFCDFLKEPEQYTMVRHLQEYPNLFILKAFTKMYAMAGLRLGYGFGPAALLEQMTQVRQPWSVSIPAQAAGIAALREMALPVQTRKLIGEERLRLKQELEQLGYLVWPGMANYLFFQDRWEEGKGSDKGYLYKACLQERVLIRSCANYPGLDSSYYRICVKTAEENSRFLEILKAVTSRRG